MKPLVLYAVEHGIAKAQMRGKWASACVEFGYTDLFCIPELTSEFISSCDSELGDSLVLSRKLRLLTCLIWNSGLLCNQCRESKPHHPACGMCHGISRVVAGTWGIFSKGGWPFETPLCSVNSGLLSSNDGKLRNLN